MATLEAEHAAAHFDYKVFTGRNLGFVTQAEQDRLRGASVFVCGVGGMGGACVLSLVRAGLGHLTVADFDRFELSNLNRQVFAFQSTIGIGKVAATESRLRDINPELVLHTYGADWTEHIDAILKDHKVVVNGMDDIACGILLYRKAREHGATVIDAYTAPLPSVTVVRPSDPRPEERLNYPTRDQAWNKLSTEMKSTCMLREIEYVMTHSSSAGHVDLAIAAEMINGKRSRMSFAPMVITTGNLMCFEAINLILGRSSGTDYRGYFFNPHSARTEHPRHPISAWFVLRVVRRFIAKLMRNA